MAVLLQSETIDLGNANIVPPEPGIRYISDRTHGRDLALQLELVGAGDAVTLICSTLAGEERFRLTARGTDSAWETHKRIARELNVNLSNLQLILPDGAAVGQNLPHKSRGLSRWGESKYSAAATAATAIAPNSWPHPGAYLKRWADSQPIGSNVLRRASEDHAADGIFKGILKYDDICTANSRRLY